MVNPLFQLCIKACGPGRIVAALALKITRWRLTAMLVQVMIVGFPFAQEKITRPSPLKYRAEPPFEQFFILE